MEKDEQRERERKGRVVRGRRTAMPTTHQISFQTVCKFPKIILFDTGYTKNAHPQQYQELEQRVREQQHSAE